MHTLYVALLIIAAIPLALNSAADESRLFRINTRALSQKSRIELLKTQLNHCLQEECEFKIESCLKEIARNPEENILDASHMAFAVKRDIAIVKMLVALHAPLDEIYCGSTPLGWAAQYGKFETVEYLCALNVQVNRRLRSNATALHGAASSGCTRTVAALLKHKADPNLRNTAQRTPLHIALIAENSDIAKLLIDAGASWQTLDNFGDTPISLAQQKNMTDVVAYIEAKAIGI